MQWYRSARERQLQVFVLFNYTKGRKHESVAASVVDGEATWSGTLEDLPPCGRVTGEKGKSTEWYPSSMHNKSNANFGYATTEVGSGRWKVWHLDVTGLLSVFQDLPKWHGVEVIDMRTVHVESYLARKLGKYTSDGGSRKGVRTRIHAG
ncbi:hypothetical protein RUM43_009127 [Polyplax serrata]|uniref:Uncharacterized protein n=1 Tax=Polyplax serrata TaxID=468196 RepID=A0AAN8NNX9_POLSC